MYFLVDEKGKQLSTHIKESIWQRIQPFIIDNQSAAILIMHYRKSSKYTLKSHVKWEFGNKHYPNKLRYDNRIQNELGILGFAEALAFLGKE